MILRRADPDANSWPSSSSSPAASSWTRPSRSAPTSASPRCGGAIDARRAAHSPGAPGPRPHDRPRLRPLQPPPLFLPAGHHPRADEHLDAEGMGPGRVESSAAPTRASWGIRASRPAGRRGAALRLRGGRHHERPRVQGAGRPQADFASSARSTAAPRSCTAGSSSRRTSRSYAVFDHVRSPHSTWATSSRATSTASSASSSRARPWPSCAPWSSTGS